MKILVTAKRVTHPDMKITLKADGSGIDLTGMNYTINPLDEIAIEEALRIKEDRGGEVVMVCIGGEEAQAEMRCGLAMGADRGILVVSAEYVDSDGVARILVKVIGRENPDLVIMGKQAVDTDENQAPQLLAEYLGWGQACFASKVAIGQGKAVVLRDIDGGIETVEMDLPGVISVDLRLNEPRCATLPGIMKARRKPVERLGIEELGVDLSPKVVLKGFMGPPARKGCRMVASVAELVNALKEEAGVI